MNDKVYFIAASGRIKVGTTGRSVQDRMTQIGAHLADPLELIGYIDGGLPLERAIQKHLQQWHLKGEWFQDCPEVRDILKRLILRGPRAIGFTSVKAVKPTRMETAPRKRDPMMFGRTARLVWGDSALLELCALSGETEAVIAGWLDGTVRPPRLVRMAMGGILTSFAVGEGVSFCGDPDEIIRFDLAEPSR